MIQELSSEEIPYCRVCHEGDNSSNSNKATGVSLGPLYHPCKCDGSIKYVHQECLIQWLKVSKKFQTNPKCELCGELFHFQNIYAVNAPTNVIMTLKDTLIELLPRILMCIKFVTGMLLICIVWTVFLPLFSNYWMKFCWCLISSRDPRVCQKGVTLYWSDLTLRVMNGGYWSVLNDGVTLEQWSVYWYNGVVNICIIICVTVVCYELGNIVVKEIQIADLRDKIKASERRIQFNR